MKNVYLENTNNHHDKFYHMIENKDGASFTATWGRIDSNGRTQIYSINEWDKKYREKINKGYKDGLVDDTILPKGSNWLQGLSIAQRKKQGITTVTPSTKSGKEYTKEEQDKDDRYISLNVQKQKIDSLVSLMDEWSAKYDPPIDSIKGRKFITNQKYVMDSLQKLFVNKYLLNSNDMKELNLIWKKYK